MFIFFAALFIIKLSKNAVFSVPKLEVLSSLSNKKPKVKSL